jgi:glycosyltransferase involved in cell wall biosynthesis
MDLSPHANENAAGASHEQPLVTIGLPTYNRANSTLPLALASALAQTYPAVEIVVADNASTDGTGEFVRDLHDPRIRYLRHSRNCSANDNFNFCLHQARGTFFLLLHDDDLIDPEFVQDCMEACRRSAAEAGEVGVIRTGLRLISGDGAVLREIPNRARGAHLSDFVRSWFIHETSPYCCNTLLNTRALKEIGGFDSRHFLFQDVLAQIKVAAIRSTVNVPEVKASFREHQTNMGAAGRVRDWCDDSQQLLDTLCELLPEQATQLRDEGERFFARMHYQRVLQLSRLLARPIDYLTVARTFNFAVSPLRFAIRHDLRPKLRLLKRRAQFLAHS